MRIVGVRGQNPSKRSKFNGTYLGRKLQSRDRMWIPVGSERIDRPELGHAAWYNCNHRIIIHRDNRSVSDIGKLKIFKEININARSKEVCLSGLPVTQTGWWLCTWHSCCEWHGLLTMHGSTHRALTHAVWEGHSECDVHPISVRFKSIRKRPQ